MFDPKDFTVTTSCHPTNGGTVTGAGTYMAYSNVTLTATPNSGYLFNCWMEDGQVVSIQSTYSFPIRSDRHLVADFVNPSFSIGDVITNPDGSRGVVFYINPTYTGGCMVALNDVSSSCQWGSSVDIPYLRNYGWTRNDCQLSDMDGYANTTVIRDYQSNNTNYASGKVDYAHGWYVPSASQLRKIFGALPFIKNAIANAGGDTISSGTYWSSTELSDSYAWTVTTSSFEVSSSSKTTNNKLRAVHDFSINNTMRIQLSTNNAEMGTVSGTGFYTSGSQVTVTATPTGNNLFRGWTEAGHLVSVNPSYTFTANANRNLVANFAIRGGVGTLVTNPDGSQGILFHLNEDGTEGWMVALEDASTGCQWGPSSDIGIMRDRAYSHQRVLEDQSGYHNTQLIRMTLGVNNSYAASVVDFDNGWYLPSAGQLRKLYAELPFLEEALVKAGGSTLTGDTYWSSTEHSASYAFTPGFEIGYTSKTSTCRVRAIRNYHPAGDNVVLVASNNDSFGSASVSGSGAFAQNATVTVTATPNAGYQFDHWTEDGATVSYDAVYQFPFTRSRSLVAHFVVPGSVGSVVTNADGSRGVVFYADPSGVGGLMVALEDVSAGCAWGANEDILPLANWTQNLLEDMDGFANTQMIRDWQSNNSNYAAGKVDFANEWYLPSAGELRKLYAALPLIEEAIVSVGGSLMMGDSYWSSSEYSSSQAWAPAFEFSAANKTNSLRVRPVRSIFSVMTIEVVANPASGGTVTGAGHYSEGQTCTLTATSNLGYSFVNWTKDGVVVSSNPTYSFVVNNSGSYVANFEQTGDFCAIVFNLVDSYGDGWNGNQLVVNYGDCTEQLTVTSGSSASYTLNIPTGAHLTLSWINGSYISECSFTISYEGGETILEAHNLNSGFSYEFDVHCGGGEQTISLASGWNWFSTYLEITLEDLKNALVDALGNTAIQIKSKDQYITYNGSRWRGPMTTMDVIRMYKIKTTATCEITLTGPPINPEERPVTINNGANWIGFPSSASMSLGNAFSGFAISGDIIKSKDHYSSFNGSIWRGTFNTLEPGKGYVYKSKASGNRTFTFPLSH